MNIEKRKNSKGDKIYFYIATGRGVGERIATGIFVYSRPKSQVEKNHNKEALVLVETKKSELLLEQQAIGTGFIPSHKFKANFLDYYEDFVKNNVRKGNRHLQNSFTQFKLFLGKNFITPVDITEELCKRLSSGACAGYNRKWDRTLIPNPRRFSTDELYFSTLFHEAIHSTGHSSRLSRDELLRWIEIDDNHYCREELIAEHGATYLCAHTHIEPETFIYSAYYIQNYLDLLRPDPSALAAIRAKAKDAVAFLLSSTPSSPPKTTP